MPSLRKMGILRFFALLMLITPYLVTAAKAQQNVPEHLPDCALQCVATALPSSGCNVTDTACLCTNINFEYNASTCIAANCTIPDVLAAKNYHEITCGIPPRDDSSATKQVTWTLFTTALVCVIGRFFARHPHTNGSGYGFDDWTILLAMAIMIPQQALLSVMLDQGLGKDIWTVPSDQITTILLYFWISEYFYNTVMCLEKISILLLYLRIWTPISSNATRFRIICFILVGILATTGVIFAIVVTFQCTPIDYAWQRWDDLHQGKCIDTNAMIYAGAALNITYDISVYCLPIRRLWQTQMSTRKKCGIGFVFLCSLFATICSIVRLHTLVKFGESGNITWDYNLPALWSAVECHVTAICACMPALAGVIKRAWGKTFGSSYGSQPRSGPPGGEGSSGQRSVPRRAQMFEDEDDIEGLELSRLRSTAGSIGETRTDSVHVTAGGEDGKGWEDVARTPASQQKEHVERSW